MLLMTLYLQLWHKNEHYSIDGILIQSNLGVISLANWEQKELSRGILKKNLQESTFPLLRIRKSHQKPLDVLADASRCAQYIIYLPFVCYLSNPTTVNREMCSLLAHV